MTASAMFILIQFAFRLSRDDQEKFSYFYATNKHYFEVNGTINAKMMEEMTSEFSNKNKLGVQFA